MNNKDQSVIHSDKLSYKDILRDRVDKCLSSLGDRDEFIFNVNSLRSSMYFDSPGLPFRTKIDNVEREINHWLFMKVQEFRLTDRHNFYMISGMIKRMQFEYTAYYNLFQNLLEILSKHNMLIESRGFTEEWDENEKR